jgi:hypothetical protein
METPSSKLLPLQLASSFWPTTVALGLTRASWKRGTSRTPGVVAGSGRGEDGAIGGEEEAEAGVVRQEQGLAIGLADVGLEGDGRKRGGE